MKTSSNAEDYHLDEPGSVRLEWYDVMGRKVNSNSYTHYVKGDFTSVYPTQSMAVGMYLVKAIFNDKVQVQRIVKQ